MLLGFLLGFELFCGEALGLGVFGLRLSSTELHTRPGEDSFAVSRLGLSLVGARPRKEIQRPAQVKPASKTKIPSRAFHLALNLFHIVLADLMSPPTMYIIFVINFRRDRIQRSRSSHRHGPSLIFLLLRQLFILLRRSIVLRMAGLQNLSSEIL